MKNKQIQDSARIEIPFELKRPEATFFTTNTKRSPSNIQHRIYGIQNASQQIISIIQSSIHPERKAEKISKIIHQTSSIYKQLAYCSQSGIDWKRSGINKMQHGLLSKLQGGHAMEFLLVEAMIKTKEEGGKGFDFRPVSQLDLNHKIDMISRLPYKQNNTPLRTFAFGTQITPEEINSEKYKIKENQLIKSIAHTENTHTQGKIGENFGRIYQTNMISYIAINGSIRKYLCGKDPILKHFRKWRRDNFTKSGLLEYIPESIRKTICLIAKSLFETQKFIISEDFIVKSMKSFSKKQEIGIINNEKNSTENSF